MLWAQTVVAEIGSPAQPSPTPGSQGTSNSSAGSRSVTTSDGATESPLSVDDTLKHGKSSVSVVESFAASSQIQFDTNIHGQFSPFNDAFHDVVEDSGFAPNHDLNFLAERTSVSPSKPYLSSNDTASPKNCADTHQVSNLHCILDSCNYHIYQSSPLTQIGNTPPPGDLYLTEWHNGVATLLPPVFREITSRMPEFPPLRNAVLALSAAYLAHLKSLIVRTTYRTRKSRYVPQKDHQYQSLQFYNEGIQGIGSYLEMIPQRNPIHVLAALLLFYYFELDSGSFTGGIGHMTVIDNFLSSNHEEVKSSPTGQKLLCTWMNLRSLFVNRYLGGYRSSKPAHSIDTFPLNCTITDERPLYDSITIIMCDCKLISRKIILDWCVVRGEHRNAVKKLPIDDVLTQMSLPKSRHESVSQLALVDDSYRDSLEMQRSRLDKWHSSLDLSELPIDSYVSQRQDFTRHSTTELDVLPLKFYTFEAAMKYVYYGYAQMLCSQDVFNRLQSATFAEPPYTRKDCPWVELILRITSGLDAADCIYKNTFTTGILSILTSCIVLCPRADVASWIEEWIRKVEDFGVPLETGLPFGIAKRIIRFILDQRRNERDVLLMLPLDTEDAEKSDLYHSDFEMQVVVCVKDMHTGMLYNETVEIPV